MSLKQEDFRKLLATPRPGSTVPDLRQQSLAAKNASTTQYAQKRRKNDDSSEFKKPPPRFMHKKWKTEKGQQETVEIASGYRDRASERRSGINPDFEDTEQILASFASKNGQISKNVEKDEDINVSISYEESKYLGGDLKHTHLVKGLDFALLQKVKNDELAERKATEEEEANAYIDALYGSGPVTFKSSLAEAIYNAVNTVENYPQANEFFYPGRMSYQWFLGFDDGDEYHGSPDIPTTVIRSRADIRDIELKMHTRNNNNLVIEKVCDVIGYLRHGSRGITGGDGTIEKKRIKRKVKEKMKEEQKKEHEHTVIPADSVLDNDEDIFADAPSDYVLEVKDRELLKPSRKQNYFGNSEEENSTPHQVMNAEELPSTELPLNQSLAGLLTSVGLDESYINIKKEKFSRVAENKDIDTSNQRLKRLKKATIDPTDDLDPYSADIMDFSDGDDGGNQDDELEAEQVDLGTRQNKKRQLSRFDFDDEEQWQEYKMNQVKIPKAAFAFRVKAVDGGGGAGSLVKKAMKGKRSDKDKFNREMQSVERIMKEKYGE